VAPKLVLTLDALLVVQLTEPLDAQRTMFVLVKEVTVGAVIPKHLQVAD
jgi:hypothetical protein